MPPRHADMTVSPMAEDALTPEVILGLETQDSAPIPLSVSDIPSLDTAFTALCAALTAHLPVEAVALKAHITETANIYADGNHLFAWREAFAILEQTAVLRGV